VEQAGSRKESAMTDWDLMTEYIHNAMHVVDKAHAATRQLRENASPETYENFVAQMQELIGHLAKLQKVLDNQEAFALDEFADWLSKGFTGKPSEYRRTPRMEADPSAPAQS